jgi:uncharacterized membrane protein
MLSTSMKISFTRYPIDIILCIFWSLLILPIALLSMDSTLRTIVGLPFILFIPGYVIVFILFPTKKNNHGIDGYERIAFSFALSLGTVPLLCFFLNYTPWGIRIESVLLSIFILILVSSVIAVYRWKRTSPEKRSIISIEIPVPTFNNKLNDVLVIILIFSIILSGSVLLYTIITPKTGEAFTEFYLLGEGGKTNNYPEKLRKGETGYVVIGLANHEHKQINYTLEIWLINSTNVYNSTKNQNETTYNEMWYFDKINITLQDFVKTKGDVWSPQWEFPYSFNINKTGKYSLNFFLFTEPTLEYDSIQNYKSIASEKISDSYENLFINLEIN